MIIIIMISLIATILLDALYPTGLEDTWEFEYGSTEILEITWNFHFLPREVVKKTNILRSGWP